MAIKIRKKAEPEKQEEKKVLEPEVLAPEGTEAAGVNEVKVPEMSDKFLRTSGSFMDWLMTHRRAVILCVCIIAAAAFSIVGVGYVQESSATEKSSVLTPFFETYTALTKDEADLLQKQREAYLKQQGIGADTSEVLKSEFYVPNDKARYEKIAGELKKTLPQYEQETIGTTGQLMLAGSSARLGNAADASAAYDKAAKDVMHSDIQLFGKLGEAEMLINAKKYDEALNVLRDINAANPKLASYMLLEEGRVFEMKGDTAGAIEAYKAVLKANDAYDMKIASNRLRVLTPDWSEIVRQASQPSQAPVQQAL